jgi:putative ABC transport system permease protein
MGIPVRKGRVIGASDTENAPRVAVVNEQLARQQFKDMDPIGQRIILHGVDSQPYEIVGVVGGSRQFNLSGDPAPEIFTPYRQSQLQYMYVVAKARGNGNAANLSAPIRSIVHDLDPDQPVGHITLEEKLQNVIRGPRVYASMIAAFAALALILAAVGIYGVLSYVVAQRTREIGIRMALGATRTNVWNQVLGRGLLLALIGLGAGIALSLAFTRAISRLLYHVGATDPWSFIAASAVLLLVAFIACNVPAYRATKVDPMVALRFQ